MVFKDLQMKVHSCFFEAFIHSSQQSSSDVTMWHRLSYSILY